MTSEPVSERDLRTSLTLLASGMNRVDKAIEKFDEKLDAHKDAVETRLDNGAERMGGIEGSVRELERQGKWRNGHIEELLVFMDTHQKADERSNGRKDQRADDLARVKSLRDYWPLIAGAVLALSSVASFVFGGPRW